MSSIINPMIDKYPPHSFDCITLPMTSHVDSVNPPETAYNPNAIITQPMTMPTTPCIIMRVFDKPFSPLRTSLIASAKHKRFETDCSARCTRRANLSATLLVPCNLYYDVAIQLRAHALVSSTRFSHSSTRVLKRCSCSICRPCPARSNTASVARG